MKQYLKKSNNDKMRNLYILLGSILIISYDSYWFGTSGIKIFELLRNLFVVGLPIYLYATNPHILISQKNSNILFILISIVSISSVFNGNNISAPLLIFSSIFLAFYLMTRYSFYDIAKAFSNIILINSIYALVIYAGVTLKIIPLKTITNVADTLVLTAFGCQFFHGLGDVILRNSSIFREPGVYMIMLNFAIIFQLFVIRDKHMWRNVIVLIVSMVTLMSTGGFICMAMILMVYFFNSAKGLINIALIAGVLLMLIIPSINEEYIDFVFNNKFNEIETRGSGFARMSSFFVPLNIFFKYPILGCGFEQFKVEYVNVGQELFHRYIDPQGMSTNTIMNIFAIWGIFLGSFYVYGFYKISKLITAGRNIISTVLMLLCLFMMFSNESMPYWSFIYIFMFYGISTRNQHQIPIKSNEQKHIDFVSRV